MPKLLETTMREGWRQCNPVISLSDNSFGQSLEERVQDIVQEKPIVL